MLAGKQIDVQTWDAALLVPDPDTLISSSYNMQGNKATRVDGGFRLSGTWRSSSGIHHAKWVVVGADVEVDGDAEVQQAVRFALFHVLQAGARAERRAVDAIDHGDQLEESAVGAQPAAIERAVREAVQQSTLRSRPEERVAQTKGKRVVSLHPGSDGR